MRAAETTGQIELNGEVELRIIRCGCGDPDSHNGVRGPAGICPRPAAIEERPAVLDAKSVQEQEQEP